MRREKIDRVQSRQLTAEERRNISMEMARKNSSLVIRRKKAIYILSE